MKKVVLLVAVLLLVFAQLSFASTTPRMEEFLNQAEGQSYCFVAANGRQCVDVAKAYANYIFNEDWTTTLRYGHAKDIYNNANGDYWEKIPNIWGDLNSMPIRGDVVVWGNSPRRTTEFGHVGVVLSATGTNITVLNQDGFINSLTKIDTIGYGTNISGEVVGWLRPKASKMKGSQSVSKVPSNTGESRGARSLTTEGWYLFIRSGPSKSNSIVGKIPENGRFTVTNVNDLRSGFYPVEYNGVTGWSSADWLELDPAPPEDTVQTMTKQEVVELPYRTVRQESDEYMKGEEIVQQQGVNGSIVDMVEITYKNGEEVDRKVIESTKYEPTDEIILVGTREDDIYTISQEDKVELDYTIIRQESDKYMKGEEIVQQEGVKGFKLITYEVTYTNGEETSRDIISEDITEPVDKIIVVGTKVDDIYTINEVKEEEIDFQTKYETSDKYKAGEQITTQEGVKGVKTITYEVEYKNGEEVNRKVIKEDVTEPVNKIIVVGTNYQMMMTDTSTVNNSTNLTNISYTGSNNPVNNTNYETLEMGNDTLSNNSSVNVKPRKSNRKLTPKQKQDVIVNAHIMSPPSKVSMSNKLTRVQALTLIIKLQGEGKYAEALTESEITSTLSVVEDISEIPNWGRRFIAYSIRKGLTGGVGSTKPGMIKIAPNGLVDGKVFAIMLLKSMGYTNMTMNNTYDKSVIAGLDGPSIQQMINIQGMNRGDTAVIIYDFIKNANIASSNGILPSNTKFKRKLINQGILDEAFTESNF